jgi:hypothetical protein
VKGNVQTRYRLIRRGNCGGAFYCVDTETGKRSSLGAVTEDEARQIVEAKYQARRQPQLNLHIARAHLVGTDSGIATRTWQDALNVIIESKLGSTQRRWRCAAKESRFFDRITVRSLFAARVSDERTNASALMRQTLLSKRIARVHR